MTDYRILPSLGIIVTDQGGVYRIPTVGPAFPVLPPALPQRDDGRGYLCVDLPSTDGKRQTVKVHRLVMEAFCGSLPNGYHIDHYDHDKTNNRLSNLRWRRISENSADSLKTTRKGAKHTTTEQKAAVQALLKAGWSTTAIASTGLVSETTARRLRLAKG